MGDYLQAGEASWHVISHPAQLSLANPPWIGAEYQQSKLGRKQEAHHAMHYPHVLGLTV